MVGIDIWQPSLALARSNVAASPHAARIAIRPQDVTELDELAAYTLAWLPVPFLPRAVVEAAVHRLAVALVPNGHLVAGLFAVPTDKAGVALTAYGSCAMAAICGISARSSSYSVPEALSMWRLA